MSNIIYLNIGGTIFQTTATTLLKSEYLTIMIMGDFAESKMGNSLENAIFIDRDPVLFKYILSYLHNYKYVFPKELHDNIVNEMDYYHVTYHGDRNMDCDDMTKHVVLMEITVNGVNLYPNVIENAIKVQSLYNSYSDLSSYEKHNKGVGKIFDEMYRLGYTIDDTKIFQTDIQISYEKISYFNKFITWSKYL